MSASADLPGDERLVVPSRPVGVERFDSTSLAVEVSLHDAEKADHLRNHITDGHFHDGCRWCKRRRVHGGNGTEGDDA